MSYTGTVRCGYCYEKGHNRATCAKLKSHVEEDPNSYTATKYRARKERNSRNGKAIRKCSYCQNTGHNKKTCPKIKTDTFNTARANRTFRKDFLTRCKALGFGPGTLMEFKLPDNADQWDRSTFERMREERGVLAMVVGFKNNRINSDLGFGKKHLRGNQKFLVKLKFTRGRDRNVALPKEFEDLIGPSNINGQWSIGCEVNQENIDRCFTSDWRMGNAGVDVQLGLVTD